MSEARISRRLAAILAADLVGYSRLVSQDEEGTISRLTALRAEFLDPGVDRHNGRIVKTMGDGFLIEYPSAVDAVRNAVELQSQLEEHNTGLTYDKKMVFRIGVNLGDVIVQEDDILGDGVNIAARLEGIAVPGGVCISNKVGTEVTGKIDVVFQDGGKYEVKNIPEPVGVLHWHPNQDVTLPVGEIASQDEDSQEDRKPNLMFMPLEPFGDSDDVKSLAATIDDEVSIALAKLTGISLVTVLDEADYVAKGSVRVAGNRFRATVQLHEQAQQEQLWSERFEGSSEDIFDAMDELSVRISNSLRYEIYERETEKSKQRPPEEQTNQELLGQAGHILFQSRRAEYQKSRELISMVVDRDPDDPMALAIGSWGHTLVEVICGYGPIEPQDGKVGMQYIRRSLELNERSAFGHLVQGLLYLHWERDTSAAILEAERALELNDGYPLAMGLMGEARSYSGDPENGIELCTKALETDARFPANHWFMEGIALGNFVTEDYEAAIEWAKRADQRQRDVPRILLMMTAASAHAGQTDAAAKTAQRLLDACPGFRVGDLRHWVFDNADDWTRFTSGLSKAGLPE
jgi:adenylate cyclase